MFVFLFPFQTPGGVIEPLVQGVFCWYHLPKHPCSDSTLSSKKQLAVCSPFSEQDKLLVQRIQSTTSAADKRSIGQGPTKSSQEGRLGKCFECNLLMDGSGISEEVLEIEGSPVICSLMASPSPCLRILIFFISNFVYQQ